MLGMQGHRPHRRRGADRRWTRPALQGALPLVLELFDMLKTRCDCCGGYVPRTRPHGRLMLCGYCLYRAKRTPTIRKNCTWDDTLKSSGLRVRRENGR